MKKTLKAAIYIRVSTDAQREEGYSIEAQTEKLTAFCVSRDIKNYDFYIDGGFTGSNIDRPEMQRLINDAKNNSLSHVIVYKLDRMSRSQKDTLYLIEDVFLPHGVDFVSLNENLDTSTPYGRAMIGILSAFAQLERETIRERTRMGMRERVKDGYWMGGGRIPFGYDYDSKQGILIPNNDAETVKKIYNLYLQGHSISRVSQMVGLKYERLAIQILNRKSNCGYINYNGEEYIGRHEAIIDLETYERAMEIQRERSLRAFRATSVYLLTGLVYCNNCGAKMRYQKWGKKGCKLICYSQDKSKPHLVKDPNCKQEKIWAVDIEKAVIDALFSFTFDYGDEEEPAAEVSALELLKQQHDNCAKKISRLYHLFGESDDDLLLEAIESSKRDLARISKQIQFETERNVVSNKIQSLQIKTRDLKSTWPAMSAHERQTIARELIDKITIDGEQAVIKFKF